MKMTATEHAKVVQLVDPDSYAAAAAVNSTSVDCKGFNEALFIFGLGDFTATGDVDFHIEESDDDSTFTDVTGATVAEKIQANDETVYVGRVDLTKRKRYLRVVYDVDDDAVEMSVHCVLLQPKELPVSQVNTVSFSV